VTDTDDLDKAHGNYFALADNGGVIGFVDSLISTQKLMYTLNYGNSWTSCLFDDSDHDVYYIDSDPDSYFPALLMMSKASSPAVTEYYIRHIDFGALVTHPCDNTTDYEAFKLQNGVGVNNSCVMGQQVTYQRRKPVRTTTPSQSNLRT